MRKEYRGKKKKRDKDNSTHEGRNKLLPWSFKIHFISFHNIKFTLVTWQIRTAYQKTSNKKVASASLRQHRLWTYT